MRDSRVPPSKCLDCGKPMDGAMDIVGDHTPEPGSVGICMDCGHVMVYADDLTLREPNDEEIKELAGHPELLKHMKLLEGFHKWRKWRHAQEKKTP
jgi:hypothetical protein